MKPLLLSVLTFTALFLGLLATPSSAAPPSREELTKTFGEGVELFKQEQWDASDRKFVEILRHVPNHAQSLRYRSLIRRERAKEASVPAVYKELSKLMVDTVNLEDATLEEALDFISVRSKQLSEGKLVPNFVLRSPDGDQSFAERKITLSLNKVPLSAVLDLIGKSAKTKFSFEKYAIVATPTADPRQAGVSVVDDQKAAPTLRAR